MRSRAREWTMPVEDIPLTLQMIEEKIAASEIEMQHRDTFIRLKCLLKDDLDSVMVAEGTRMIINEDCGM